jgi:gliding motility-associated-like protein
MSDIFLSRNFNWIKVILSAFIFILSFMQNAYAQILGSDGENKKPKIHNQKPLATNEEEPITIQLTDLEVEDRDDPWYPWGFTLQVYSGTHYTVSGTTVYPEADYNGELTVEVTVHDGEDYSEPFHLKIPVNAVNDPPVITGQQAINILNTSSLTLTASHLIISDPDNRFPDDFQIIVYSGANYTVSGNDVRPNSDFTGPLSVPVKVSDGQAESNQYNLAIQVTQGATSPIITDQKPATIDEDQVFTLEFSYLHVTDLDDNYPDGFSLKIYEGQNYTVSENKIIPAQDFSGNLVANVSVNDGKSESNIYGFTLKVNPLNDAPRVELTGPDSIAMKRPVSAFSIMEDVMITDPDNAELALAELQFSEGYVKGADFLIFEETQNIHGAFDVNQGVLALFGKASVQEYIAAIRAVQAKFDAFTDAPVTERKKLSLMVSDGIANSNPAVRPIFFTEDGKLPPASMSDVEIPTGFTPNGDNVNDTWSITPVANSELYSTAVIRVYSRTGMLVFESTGFEKEWDGFYKGSILPPDVYYYTIDFNVPDAKQILKGIVTLLR